MTPARHLTTEAIAAELSALEALWDVLHADEDSGHSGSPGEWIIERIWELEAEQSKRAAGGDPHQPAEPA